MYSISIWIWFLFMLVHTFAEGLGPSGPAEGLLPSQKAYFNMASKIYFTPELE